MLDFMMVCYASGTQPSPQHVSTARHQSARPADVVLSKPICYTSRVGFVVQKQISILRILLHNFSGPTLTNNSSSRLSNVVLSRFRCCVSGTQANPKHLSTARHQSARPANNLVLSRFRCYTSCAGFVLAVLVNCAHSSSLSPRHNKCAFQTCYNACRLPRLQVANNLQSRPAGTMICTAQTCYTSYAFRLTSACSKLS